MTLHTGTRLFLQVVFGFCYHLAFGILFLVKLGETKTEDCIYPCYGVARASAAYFIYVAAYTLGYILLVSTNNANKLHQNIATRTVNALLHIPLLLTPIVYITLIYAASRKRACPGLDDAYTAWLIFLFTVVVLSIIFSIINLILYVLHYQKGFKIPGTQYAFGASSLTVDHSGRGQDYKNL